MTGVRVSIFAIVMTVLLALGQGPAFAQALPDAGALRQQIEQQLQEPLPPRAEPLAPAEPASLTLPEGATLTVQAFRFAGAVLVDEVRLRGVVEPYVGHPIGFAQLQEASRSVAGAYREAGWIARAYLPKQDVTDGIVTIQVVEARFDGARIESADEANRVDPARILAIVDAQQAAGEPIAAAALDRALLLADDLPGVAVSGALAPGATDGETALVLAVRDEPLAGGEIGVDNAGARSTGTARVRATLRVDSPLRQGDQARGDLLHSRGSDYVRAGYSVPIGSNGLRGGLHASYLDYRLVGDDFKRLDAHGDSLAAGADLSYPLLRERSRNLYLTLGYERKRFRNHALGSVQSRYGVGALTAGMSGNLYDDLGGGGANRFSLGWTQGRVTQGALEPGENPALAGSFGVLRGAVARQQTLKHGLTLQASVSGQYTHKDLDSSERLYLGGPEGVRAYPVNEAGGSRGALASLELRWRAHPAVTLSGFVDAGQVSQAEVGPRQTLKGAGVGASWDGPRGVRVQAVLAHRIGHNALAGPDGKDADGTLKRNRLWVQASVPF